MKRYIHISMMAVVAAFFVISCGSANKKAEKQGHVHGDETHVHNEETHTHGDEIHSHENESTIPAGQEDFVVGDSIPADSLKQDSLNHDHEHDHDHDHEHGHHH
jgi:hypothetical protein